MQKALKWLDAMEVPYEFQNYKETGIDKVTLQTWLDHFPTDKLINTKGTSYRALTDAEKASITSKAKAITLMIKNPSLIKRPVWDLGRGKYFLGWDEKALSELILK